MVWELPTSKERVGNVNIIEGNLSQFGLCHCPLGVDRDSPCMIFKSESNTDPKPIACYRCSLNVC